MYWPDYDKLFILNGSLGFSKTYIHGLKQHFSNKKTIVVLDQQYRNTIYNIFKLNLRVWYLETASEMRNIAFTHFMDFLNILQKYVIERKVISKSKSCKFYNKELRKATVTRSKLINQKKQSGNDYWK